MKKRKTLSPAQRKVLKDIKGQKNESKRMRADKRLLWKLRGVLLRLEYWLVAYGMYVAIGLWVFTGDFWKGAAFYALVLTYHISANMRGLFLHLENYIEWKIDKTI